MACVPRKAFIMCQDNSWTFPLFWNNQHIVNSSLCAQEKKIIRQEIHSPSPHFPCNLCPSNTVFCSPTWVSILFLFLFWRLKVLKPQNVISRPNVNCFKEKNKIIFWKHVSFLEDLEKMGPPKELKVSRNILGYIRILLKSNVVIIMLHVFWGLKPIPWSDFFSPLICMNYHFKLTKKIKYIFF